MKKLALFTIFLLFVYSLIPTVVYAEEQVSFDSVLQTLLDSLDSEALDKELDEVWEELSLEKASFSDKIRLVLSGDFKADYGSIFSALFELVFSGLKSMLPVLISVCSIALVYSIAKNLSPDFLSDGIGKVLHFVCYAAVVSLLIFKTFDIVSDCFEGIDKYAKQMDIVFPVIITVMAATGANVSAAVYQPAVAFLSKGITGVVTSILLPMIVFIIVMSVVSGLSGAFKLDKFILFVSSVIKWVIGISVTVFTMFLSIQGLTAGMYDGISLRVAKYAIGNSVPLVGGFLKDGTDLFLASGLLIKNAVGVCGIILVISAVLAPIVELIVFTLFLKLAAGIMEPFADSKMADCVAGLSKNLGYVLASVLMVAFMYVLTIVLLICTGGMFI